MHDRGDVYISLLPLSLTVVILRDAGLADAVVVRVYGGKAEGRQRCYRQGGFYGAQKLCLLTWQSRQGRKVELGAAGAVLWLLFPLCLYLAGVYRRVD